MELRRFYATTSRGLERYLEEELIKEGCCQTKVEESIVFFNTSLINACRLNFFLRLANKIVIILDEREIKTADDLYNQALSVDWFEWFDITNTFAVESVVLSSQFLHSGFCALKVKDAIADFFRKLLNKRPSVDKFSPDIFIDLRIINNISTLGINLSGERLFKRGYSLNRGKAPLKETLAAGIMAVIRPEDYDVIIDPMAGSGTLIIEASLRVLNIPPGRYRTNFAYKKLKPLKNFSIKPFYDGNLSLLNNKIFICRDIDSNAIEKCKENIKRVGLNKIIKVERCDFFNSPLENYSNKKIVLFFNPPYGRRIKEKNIFQFYKKIGDTLKTRWKNATAWIFTEKGEHLKKIGLRSSSKVTLYNGSIECRLIKFEIY